MSAHPHTPTPLCDCDGQRCGSKLKCAMNWVDQRFPASETFKAHMSEYYAPKNFNWLYWMGVFAMLVLVLQVVTGVFLAMHYKPDAATAFASVEYIMREVPWGWLIRYMHSTGASAFFIVVYLHMFRGMIYGSHRKPRELLWVIGCLIFLCLMAEAFMGYLLPWGQMSYWGAQVITSLFEAIPAIGPDLAIWIRGDYVVSDATLNRFFSMHIVLIPLILVALVFVHIVALHHVGSNNPDGIEIKANKDANGIPLDGIPFHPYYTVHDTFGVSLFLILYFAVVFFAPEMGGYFLEYNNFIPANPLQTPAHFAPAWYFTPFYSVLRATTTQLIYVLTALIAVAAVWAWLKGGYAQRKKIFIAAGSLLAIAVMLWLDAKFWGVVLMGVSVVILFALPWLDQSPVRSIRYRPGFHKVIYALFVFDLFLLGYLGMQVPSPLSERLSQIGTLYYLGFFLLMPWWSRSGQPLPEPTRVTFKPHSH